MTKKRGNRRKVVGEDRVELVMSLGDLSKIRPIQNGSKTGFQILTTKRFTGSRPCRSRCFFAFVARSCIGSLLRRPVKSFAFPAPFLLRRSGSAASYKE
ncbi:uncharacterized protein LOC110103388 isoform X2 [Dendrobium catenatum]|uniref:uncharacterized protein LOC110103388 isoform X2 n=1 Tax=Dendrobium catenatum TaxID=906689 RepID=UPI00109F303E|nr:uncharacterized protein LOC110103388 isoform X2 [Dendrobium catenatum]